MTYNGNILNKGSILKLFSNHLIELLDDIITIFPNILILYLSMTGAYATKNNSYCIQMSSQWPIQEL